MAVHDIRRHVQMPSASPHVTAATFLAATSHEVAMLHDVVELLSNLFARNRNQHRRSHWWKSLHEFRKQIKLLLAELEGKKSERKSKIEARLKYWDERCIHQWYYQFSQLVAVGSFAILGLVLMASVARVCRITGITSVYEEIASADVQGVLSANDDLALATEFSHIMNNRDEEDDWDEGVVVMRVD